MINMRKKIGFGIVLLIIGVGAAFWLSNSPQTESQIIRNRGVLSLSDASFDDVVGGGNLVSR